jgi:uncharacterized membrane protein
VQLHHQDLELVALVRQEQKYKQMIAFLYLNFFRWGLREKANQKRSTSRARLPIGVDKRARLFIRHIANTARRQHFQKIRQQPGVQTAPPVNPHHVSKTAAHRSETQIGLQLGADQRQRIGDELCAHAAARRAQ